MREISGQLHYLRRNGDFRIYKVQEWGAQRPCLLLTAASEDPGTVVRMKQEIALTGGLDSEFVVRPQELVSADGRAALLIDDHDARPLSELLDGALAIPRMLRIAIGLAHSIGHVHERGLVHRNIRPDHIWVDSSDRVWITGFGGASRLPRERSDLAIHESLVGSPVYMSPEQTGRVNRSIDSRSDLYVMGIVLYQMLAAGALPFGASGPMQWIHYHIARKPNPLPYAGPETTAIDDLVFRLLSKSAEDRYQTAAGVEKDLRSCLRAWEETGSTAAVKLSALDAPGTLRMTEKLYGREAEINALLSAYHRVAASGVAEWIFISGYSGVGKSSAVNELRKALAPTNGSFISGKFDQFKRDIPYATIAQAFQSLVRQILGRDNDDLTYWRNVLRDAVGANGELLVNLVPELELIIGEQPPLSDLPSQEARSRFEAVLGRFIGALARPEHPLVLFLDDLQWPDAATLELLVRLASDVDLTHLLLICAYRENEVDAAHPLVPALEAIRHGATRIEEMRLLPLGLDDVRNLVSDVLRSDREQISPLAELIHQKTGGNPFFSIQFFSALAEEHLLVFHPLRKEWTWNIDLIEAKGFTNNVVDLMARKLDKLPTRTLEILKKFSCLGMNSNAAILGDLCNMSQDEIHDGLAGLVMSGLLRRTDVEYRFMHDRVREAAYLLIPEPLLPAEHLSIARYLAAGAKAVASSDAIFQIVNHFNLGLALIASESERDDVARYNLAAGLRAKRSIAHQSALIYLTAAHSLLSSDAWTRQPALAFDVEYNLAESEFLTGTLSAAEARLQHLMVRCQSPAERATVVALQVTIYTALDRSEHAVATCLAYLREIGIAWSQHPTKQEARDEYELLTQRLAGTSIEALLDLPLSTDREQRATLGVITAVLAPAFFTDANLVCLVLCRMANLSIQHGNSGASALAYAYLGMVLGPHFGDYPAALRFGTLGLKLVETRGLDQYKARVHLTYGAHVVPFAIPLSVAQPYLRRAFDEANESGDMTYAGFSSCCIVTNRLSAGDPLDQVEQEASARLAFVQKAKFGLIVHIITAQLRLIRMLRGLSSDFNSLNGDDFDEERFEEQLSSNRSLDIAACWFWIRKMQSRFFCGDYAAAYEALRRAEPLLWTTSGHLELAVFHFYGGLVRAAYYDSAPHDLRETLLAGIVADHRQIAEWESHSRETYESAAALVAAEIARIDGRALDAMDLYEKSIRSSRLSGSIHTEAVAHEVAARFYLGRGFETTFDAYLRNARECYRKWGAAGKVAQLERLHPELAAGAAADTHIEPDIVEHFDLATVVKTSEAVSNEFGLSRLIDTLMTLVLEHTGAHRGILILPQHNELQIGAEAKTEQDRIHVLLRNAPISAAELPTSIVNLVARTRQGIIIDDAQASNQFSEDPYFSSGRSRSVLCLPLVKQTKLIGIIFLENDLAASVFTPAKVSVLKLLASQAAISMENASLEEKDALVEALQKSQSELVRMSRLTAVGELVISIAHEVNQPLTAIIMNADVCLRWMNNEKPSLAEARKAAERVIENGKRAAEVVRTIRGLAVKSTPEMSSLDINEATKEMLSILGAELRQNNVHLETEFAEGRNMVTGNKVQLQQVLLNLSMNAIESMAAIEGRRILSISSQAGEDDTVVVTVTDNGLGFDESRIEQMFEALVTTKPQGMGMGLSISKSIVEAHGGRLWATSASPRGASFHFSVPTIPRE